MSSAPFHRRIALATCVVLSAVPLSSALAQQPPRGEQARAEMMERGERGNRGDERSLSDAVRRVQRTTGGHILGNRFSTLHANEILTREDELARRFLHIDSTLVLLRQVEQRRRSHMLDIAHAGCRNGSPVAE